MSCVQILHSDVSSTLWIDFVAKFKDVVHDPGVRVSKSIRKEQTSIVIFLRPGKRFSSILFKKVDHLNFANVAHERNPFDGNTERCIETGRNSERSADIGTTRRRISSQSMGLLSTRDEKNIGQKSSTPQHGVRFISFGLNEGRQEGFVGRKCYV